jgi:hypothetical protein
VRKQTLTDIFIDEGDKDGRLRCLIANGPRSPFL